MRRIPFFLVAVAMLLALAGNSSAQDRTLGARRFLLDDGTLLNPLYMTDNLGSMGVDNFGIVTPGVFPSQCALLDLSSTTKGFLTPRMTNAQELGICSGTPPEGLIVYNLTTHTLDVYNGSGWGPIGGGWLLRGNFIPSGGTALGSDYIGTNNAQDFVLATNGVEVARWGGVAGPGQGNLGLGGAPTAAKLTVTGNSLITGNEQVNGQFTSAGNSTVATNAGTTNTFGSGGGATFNTFGNNAQSNLFGNFNTNINNFGATATTNVFGDNTPLNDFGDAQSAANIVNFIGSSISSTGTVTNNIGNRSAGAVTTNIGTVGTVSNNIGNASATNTVLGTTNINATGNASTTIGSTTNTSAVSIASNNATAITLDVANTANNLRLNNIANGLLATDINFLVLTAPNSGNTRWRALNSFVTGSNGVEVTYVGGVADAHFAPNNNSVLFTSDRFINTDGFTLHVTSGTPGTNDLLTAGGTTVNVNNAVSGATNIGNVAGSSNIIGNNAFQNQLGIGAQNNFIGQGGSNNNFGFISAFNEFGNNSTNNQFGNNSGTNQFGVGATTNAIGTTGTSTNNIGGTNNINTTGFGLTTMGNSTSNQWFRLNGVADAVATDAIGSAHWDLAVQGDIFASGMMKSASATISGLVPGQVVFPDANSQLTGNAQLFWDNANTVLDVGTNVTNAVSGRKLQVSNNENPANGDAHQLIVTGTGATANEMLELGYNTTANNATIQSVNQGVGATNLLIQPSGIAGVGRTIVGSSVASTNSRLEVNGVTGDLAGGPSFTNGPDNGWDFYDQGDAQIAGILKVGTASIVMNGNSSPATITGFTNDLTISAGTATKNVNINAGGGGSSVNINTANGQTTNIATITGAVTNIGTAAASINNIGTGAGGTTNFIGSSATLNQFGNFASQNEYGTNANVNFIGAGAVTNNLGLFGTETNNITGTTNINTGVNNLTTVGNGASSQHLLVNGVTDAVAGDAAGNPHWDMQVNGDEIVTGMLKVNSLVIPPLIPGYVIFAGPSGQLAQDNAVTGDFFWDRVNHRLGLGTNGPLFQLDVNGTTRLVGPAITSNTLIVGALLTGNGGEIINGGSTINGGATINNGTTLNNLTVAADNWMTTTPNNTGGQVHTRQISALPFPGGSIPITTQALAGPYNINALTDYLVIAVNAALGTVNLPAAGLNTGKVFVIKRAGAGNVNVGTAGGNIDGVAPPFVMGAANQVAGFTSDGANWWIISN